MFSYVSHLVTLVVADGQVVLGVFVESLPAARAALGRQYVASRSLSLRHS